jgi:hypothetical protein
MTAKEIIWTAMAIVVCVILPICMVIGAWQHLRNGSRRESRRRPGGVTMGSALQELDRIVARPSIEYTIEAETPILKRENDQGGD